jgi:DNA-binding CsgD family transcriptional regulator
MAERGGGRLGRGYGLAGGWELLLIAPIRLTTFLPLPFDGVWASALVAAFFSALVLFGFASTLPAAEAALEPVWRLLRAKGHSLLPAPRVRQTEAGAETGASLGLTAREVEVLVLVAAGRTNRQIGQALFITPKTASVHVSRILAKLGVAGRGEAAAIAHRLGLDKQ